MISKVLVGLVLLSAMAFAGDINLWVDDSAGVIGLVDVTPGPNLGHVTIVGPSGVILTDIAFDSSGALFGIGPLSGPPYDLYSLSTSTGAATPIGPLNPSLNPVACALGSCPPNSLVFGSDGALYTATDDLFTIDPATGADTDVGPLGSGFVSGGDLAFVDGTMLLATANDLLVSVDPTDGVATLVGDLGEANMFGLASPDGTTLYGVADTSVYTINPADGSATFLLNYSGQGLGQAYGEAFFTEAELPEPSTFGLLGAGMLAVSLLRRKRLL